MRILLLLSALELSLATAFPQAAPAEPTPVAQLRQLLTEAAGLQETELQKVPEKLAPLLTELRGRLQTGNLDAESRSIFQEALLLQMRTQSKLLADEATIAATVRDIMVVAPLVGDAVFNPREKLLVDRIRSAETGRLSLQTAPPGAGLLYLGQSLGTTPVDLPLIAGSYKLLLHKDGYRDEPFEVTIRPAELLGMERGLRRRAVQIPISVKALAVEVRVNGQPAGRGTGYDDWLASLLPEQKAQIQSSPGWAGDKSSSYLSLADIPVGDTVAIDLAAPCYEPKTLSVTVRDEEVDWGKPLLVRPELVNVELKKDLGTLEVGSTPEGGEVLLDGVTTGKTPLRLDVCVGRHEVRVVHPAGQFVKEVLVERGRSTGAAGDLKPALAFLGVYGPGTAAGSLAPSLPDWEPVARRLATGMSTFGLTGGGASGRQPGGSAVPEKLIAAERSPADLASMVAAASQQAGRVDLLLFGLRMGDSLVFRLYGKLSPHPDLIEVPNVEAAALDFLVAQIDNAGRVPSRMVTPHVALSLLETTRGLVVVKDQRPAAEAQSPIPPGSVIRSVDQRPMDYGQFQTYLRTRRPGQSVALEFEAGGSVQRWPCASRGRSTRGARPTGWSMPSWRSSTICWSATPPTPPHVLPP